MRFRESPIRIEHMPDAFKYDVFLSHNHADKPRVRQLAERLKAAGVRVWLDEWVIQAGDIIALKVDEGLEQSRVLLLCISPAALASGWVALERSTAVHRDPANAGRRFIPLLLGDCDLPDTLRRYKYVDFREESDVAFAEVLAACLSETESVPPASQQKVPKTSATKEPDPTEPPEKTELLAVLERKLTGHRRWVRSLTISSDGKWIASGGHDTTVKIWDIMNGECRMTLKGHTANVKSVAITPDGRLIVSGSDDRSIRVWDRRSRRELANLDGHIGEVRSVVALQDNIRAFSAGLDGTLKIWNLASYACLKTIECGLDDADKVYSSAVNKDGNQALSGHQDGRIRLWDLESSACLATLKGHTNTVYSIQISPDGGYAVSGSRDRTIRAF